jgi:uncharacterized surface protein with fasciclin (FAS1) repeats
MSDTKSIQQIMRKLLYLFMVLCVSFQMKAQTVVDIIVASPDHNTLEAAVIAAELADDLSGPGPFTVFAPTDAAFAALPAGTVDALLADPTGDLANILLYHVLGLQALSTDLVDGMIVTTLLGEEITVTINGSGVFINDAQVTVADLAATNGVVHVIDAVLLPPVMPTNTIMDIVTNSADHTTLEAALVASGLNETLGNPGDFTLFAPTDAAFALLPAGTVDALLADPNGQLVDVLLYHVLAGTVVSSVLEDGMVVTTAQGSDVTVTINANGVFINDAQVIVADIMADNGVVHVIDAVLLPPAQTSTVVDIIVNSPDHNTLEAAVVAAGLVETLSGPGPFTVFAPTDAAFDALPAGTVEALLADPTGALTQILLYHVVGATALSTDLSDGQVIATLNGADVIVTISGGVFINNAQVTVADIVADNGVVHVINAVLLPPAPVIEGCTATEACNYNPDANVEDGSCILPGEPCDDGNDLTIGDVYGADCICAGLTEGCTSDLACNYDATASIDNGTCYFPGDNCDDNNTATVNDVYTADCGCAGTLPSNTVVDIIVNSPDHNTLEAAVIAAELADDLSGTGPFTVFAPTDAAFAALPAGVIDALLADPTGALAEVLLYHVVGGLALSTDLSDGQVITTLLGEDVTVTINANGVFVNNAQVVVADIIADNGVVHVIDAVLVPAAEPTTVVDIIINSDVHNTLETAVIAAGLADDLSGTGPFTVFAPTDAAFAALPAGVLDALLADPTGALAEVLLYHVVGGLALSTDLSDGMVVTTLLGSDITVSIFDGNVFINDALVTVADIIADNGVVHVITAVLLPPAPQTEGCTAIEACNYNPDATVEDGSCILPGEPCDDMNANTVNDILGSDCVCTGDLLGCTDMTACNYDMSAVVDNGACQFPGDNCDDANDATINDVFGSDCSCAGIISNNTVVDIIVNSPDHTTLEAAVIAAELADDLSGTGPFTVFAPTDAAFAALPAGVIDALLADPTGDLASILLYHVVGGLALSTDLVDGQVITTLLGQDITVTIDMNGVMINNANVIVADIIADNGVVHVIDAVLVPAAEPTTVVDIIVNSDVHNTLETAVIAAGLADDLSGTGPFTVFAPTDAAFAALPAGVIDALLADPTGALAEVLLYHVVGGLALSTDLSDGQVITTLLGADITVTIDMNGVMINNAMVVVADILADNGVVHVIDAVLVPAAEPTTVVDIIVNSPDHTTLEAAVIAAELADDLSGTGPFTVFAPTDAAFAALPAGVIDALLADPTGALAEVLLYHVVGGLALSTDLSDGQMITTLLGEDITVTIDANGVMINDAMVIVADILADNGVVHVIDAVLLPPPPQPTNTILDIVVNSADHNTLEAAVVAAGLQSALSGTGPLTVFAPTDAAFAALPAGVLDALLADPTGALTQVLLYHAVGGVALSTDLSDGMMITTIQGQDITVTINANGVFINDAQVIVADIIADNGVVHVIDAVLVPELNPEPTTVVDIIVNSPNHITLETAVIAAGLADDLSGDGPFTVFAPTDAAFAALPAGVLDALLADPTGALAQVLLYHVVSGEALSSSLTNGQTITTLQGQDVTVSITGGNVFINNAQVIMADIMADNGVVHVIDAVLTPSTSVNEATMNSALVYPNPAADQLTVSLPSMAGATVYSIFSITGELVATGNMYSTTTTLSVDALAQGMYQLKLVNGNDCVTRSFMKK